VSTKAGHPQHGYSGAYDVVSRNVANYLRANEDTRHTPLSGEWTDERSSTTIEIEPDTIRMLEWRGFLTSKTAADEHDAVRRLAERRHTFERVSRPSYILMPSYQCNLRCPYCFQDHMRTRPELSHLLKTMSKDMARRIMKAMTSIDAMHPGAEGKPRRITLFGGEPLMRENREFVGWWIDELKAASPCEISAVTNATQLDAYADLLGPHAIRHIQITIDGPPAVHDQRRIHADGSGSFELIAANMRFALERGVQVAVRVNVDRTNIAQLPELAREIIARGWYEHPAFRAYAAAVNASNEQTEKKDTYNSYALSVRMEELRASFPELRAIARPSDELRGTVLRILSGDAQPWQMYKASYCGAHSTMYVFDAFGDIYACWERTGDPSIKIGSIDQNGDPNLRHRKGPAIVTPGKRLLPIAGKPLVDDIDTWRERTISTNETCATCRYAFYCGGGCAAEAMDHRGSFHTNFCNGFQQRFRVAAADAYDDVRRGRLASLSSAVGCGE